MLLLSPASAQRFIYLIAGAVVKRIELETDAEARSGDSEGPVASPEHVTEILALIEYETPFAKLSESLLGDIHKLAFGKLK